MLPLSKSLIAVLLLALLLVGLAKADDTVTPSHDDDGHDDHDDHDHDESVTTSHDDHDDHDHDDDDDHDDHDHDDDHETTDSATANKIKGAAIAVTFSSSMIINVAVIYFAPHLPPLFLKLLTAFSGGVMLVTGVCHILGESTAIFEAQFEGNIEQIRPSFAMCVVGVLVMMFMQRALTSHSHSHGADDGSESEEKGKDASPSSPGLTSPDTAGVVVGSSEPVWPEREAPTASGATILSRVLLLAMFVFHSIIEGMAMGLQQTKEGTVVIFVAIMVHQWAEDLSYSLSTARGNIPRWLRLVLSTCEAASCPVGIAIGWGIGVHVESLVTGYLLALSSGTFLMLSLVEIVPEVMPSGKRSSIAFTAYFAGAGLMYMLLVLIFDKEAHNH